MHTLLTLSSIMFIVLACYLTLRMLNRLEGWTSRRDLQFWVLIVPLLGLILSLATMIHVVYRECLFLAPAWDYLPAIALPMSMSLIAVSSVIFGAVRLALISWFAVRHGIQAVPDIQALINHQAEKLGLPCPRLLVCIYSRPLALTYGLRQPTVLLSTWMIEQLDEHELEAVFVHELAHAARHDYIVIWLATMLRDAFFYLPTSHIAYRQLQCEKELACDDFVVELTNRPLVLASALAKVWQELASEPTFGVAQSFAGQGDLLEARIERLMTVTKPVAYKSHSRTVSLGITVLSLINLFVVEGISVAAILALMGCGPMVELFARFVG